MGDKKEPTWKEALKINREWTKKKLAPMKRVMLEIYKKKNIRLQCPYCDYSTRNKEDLHDHLTYYHWMSVPAVDKIMSEIINKEKGVIL